MNRAPSILLRSCGQRDSQPLTPDQASGGRAEQEEAEPERVAAAELDVAASAGADPLEELLDTRLVGMLAGVALAVQAPRPLVAVEVADARRHRVDRRQAELLPATHRPRVVVQLLPLRPERVEIFARRLPSPVTVAVEDEAARPHEPGERRELRRRAHTGDQVERTAPAVPGLDVGDDDVDPRGSLRE